MVKEAGGTDETVICKMYNRDAARSKVYRTGILNPNFTIFSHVGNERAPADRQPGLAA
jgi:hypothetical protein